MIKTLKNISNDEQLVSTINGKETVKAGATFETAKAEELLRNYKSLFVEVEENDVKEPVKEPENEPVKEEKMADEEIKKPAKKTLKDK